MGKSWDEFEPKEYQEFCEEWGEQVLRVLKPGGYLLAFSGTRTYHRMVTGLEDAGFEIKDQIDWLYGSGFPKSTDISKQIDKKFLREKLTEKLGHKPTRTQFKQAWECFRDFEESPNSRSGYEGREDEDYSHAKRVTVSEPVTPEASKWEGFGTSLKPSHEPIVLAQKPRDGTYAEHVLEYGVGGLNIDGCRIGNEEIEQHGRSESENVAMSGKNYAEERGCRSWRGRWPANVVLDPEAARLLDEQSEVLKSGKAGKKEVQSNTDWFGGGKLNKSNQIGDSGGASRFFYCAKAHKSERNAGLEDLDDVVYGQSGGARQKIREGGEEYIQEDHIGLNKIKKVKNDIATLKPINLMRYLVRLVTPPEGVVLDPFAGSGTTGCACVIEGFDYVLIEKRKRFANVIAPRRIEYWSDPENYDSLKNHELLEDPETLKKERSNATLENFVEE